MEEGEAQLQRAFAAGKLQAGMLLPGMLLPGKLPSRRPEKAGRRVRRMPM